MRTMPTRSLTERFEIAAAAAGDLPSLAAAVFRAVEPVVPFVFACVATLDPANGSITAAFKSHPLPMGDEDFSAAEYGGDDVNRFLDLAERRVPVGALSLDTGGHPEASRRFREFMAPQFGFTDELRVACRAAGTVWAALAFYRDDGAPFTADEARLLATLHEAVAGAVRRLLLAAPPAPAGVRAIPAVLLVDARDRVTDRGGAAEAVVEELGGWDRGSLPANVLAVTARARTARGQVESQVLARSGGWLAVRALPLTPTADGVPVVLTVESAAPGSVGRLALAAHGLTPRETEIVEEVLKGRSTAAIAGALHLSPHTVQDHLKSIFEKTGARSRRELIARFVD